MCCPPVIQMPKLGCRAAGTLSKLVPWFAICLGPLGIVVNVQGPGFKEQPPNVYNQQQQYSILWVDKILHHFYMLTCTNLGKEHVHECRNLAPPRRFWISILSRGAGFCFRRKHGLSLGWCKVSSIHRMIANIAALYGQTWVRWASSIRGCSCI